MLKSASYLFLTGKGGAGKTSLAWAKAIHLADERKTVLEIARKCTFLQTLQSTF